MIVGERLGQRRQDPRPFLKGRVGQLERRCLADGLSSPLAKVPHHLRHAAVPLWLNGCVPATQVAEWAGHSLHVLLKVYAKCIDGQEEASLLRILAALKL